MVRGLTVGILHSQVETQIETTMDKVPKQGDSTKVIVDGVALAYQVVSPENKEHSWDFVHGGDYKLYSKKVNEFIALLRKYNVDVTVVFPLADGTPPVSEQATQKWTQKALDKLKRVGRVKTMLEKAANTSRTLLEVLPPLMIQEIGETLMAKEIKVVFTRNNVTKFCADQVKKGAVDAVVGQNSDYLIFEDVNYIPIDSIFEENNEANETVLKVDLLNRDIAAEKLGLNDPEKMFQLSVLLGNLYTENFVVSKYNIPQMLHIRINPKWPDALVVGIVGYLNGDEFDSIFETSPTKEMIDGDEEFQKAIKESEEYFDVTKGMEEEGTGMVRELTEKGALPLWAPAVAEGGDFWNDVMVDDYEHPVKTEKVTLQLRKIFYAILGREKVDEHQPVGDEIEVNTVEAEAGIPTLEQLRGSDKKMDKKKLERKMKQLMGTFMNIAHCNFPEEAMKLESDPITKLPEPLLTAALAIRFLVSICYTDNQTDYSKLPSEVPKDLTPEEFKQLKDTKVVGAPPLDLFEVKALALMVLVLGSSQAGKYEKQKGFKPKLRRVKVSALYQNAVQHFIWLQQLLGIKDANTKPHRLFDGDIFAASYEARGDVANESFCDHFENTEEIMKLGKKLDKLMEAILAPFPAKLFDAFNYFPRSIALSAFEQAKPTQAEVIVVKSAFAGLMDSDDDYDEEDGEPAPPAPAPAPVVIAAPPPPPPKKVQQKKGKKQEEEDDDMEAFLLAQAAKNAQAEKAEPKVAPKAAPKKVAPKRHVRKPDLPGVNNQQFNRESKNELKRQLKQQIYDYN